MDIYVLSKEEANLVRCLISLVSLSVSKRDTICGLVLFTDRLPFFSVYSMELLGDDKSVICCGSNNL